MQNSITEKDFMNSLWNYFIQHSNQRIQLMNFYIILETFLFTGMFAVYELNSNYSVICVFISIAVIFFTFIFHNLDVRTKDMIKNCETAIKRLEKKYSKQFGKDIMVLIMEEDQTDQKRKSRFFPLSYAESFELMFHFFVLIGILSLIFNILNVTMK